MLDTIKSGQKSMMLKHLKELIVNTEPIAGNMSEPIMHCGYNSSNMSGLNGQTMKGK